MGGVEWAEKHYRFQGQSSSTPGRFRAIGYQREPMDLIAEAPELGIERVVMRKSKRTGFTKGCIVAAIGRRIHIDPCSIAVCSPTDGDSSTFSTTEIQPMFDQTPALRGLVAEQREKSSSNTIQRKSYLGGTLYMGAATSAKLFRQISVGLAFADEVDAYIASAGSGRGGGEGDQLKLLEGRMGDCPNPLLVIGSTPKHKDSSKIQREFELSDQRFYQVPCPHCDHGQPLSWGGRDHDYGIKWPEGRPLEAFYLCEQCLQPIGYRERARMVEEGHYLATNPDGLFPGWHIWAAYSPLPSAAWGKIAAEFLEVKDDPLKLQVWVNTVLGEPFEVVGKAPDDEKLLGCREAYALRETGRALPDGEPERAELVPEGVAVLTSSFDVQPDRVEQSVWGWGGGEEVWVVEHNVYHGDPTAEPLWSVVWDSMLRPRYMERGGVDYIRSTCIDANYAAQSIYQFVSPRPIYRTPEGGQGFTWAVRGSSGTGQVWPAKAGKAPNFKDCPIYTIKVDPAKEWVYARADARLKGGKSGPGTLHWPMSLGSDYFRQFTAEERFPTVNAKGFPVKVWRLRKGRLRNEVFDCSVYNYAALCALYTIGLDLDALAEQVRGKVIEAPTVAADPVVLQQPNTRYAPSEHTPRRQRKRRDEFDGWL